VATKPKSAASQLIISRFGNRVIVWPDRATVERVVRRLQRERFGKQKGRSCFPERARDGIAIANVTSDSAPPSLIAEAERVKQNADRVIREGNQLWA
jgi:hypothetical protein